jgi:hypothetical protein
MFWYIFQYFRHYLCVYPLALHIIFVSLCFNYLLNDDPLIVERRFADHNVPESCAGGRVSSWYSHLCQAFESVRTRRNVVLGPPRAIINTPENILL